MRYSGEAIQQVARTQSENKQPEEQSTLDSRVPVPEVDYAVASEKINAEAYIKEARVYIEEIRRSGVLHHFTRDSSISFQVGEKGSGFWFSKDKGMINLDPEWFIERGLDKEMIFWAILHEIRHFEDMRADPESHEQLIVRLIDKVKAYAPVLVEKWRAGIDFNDDAQAKYFEKITKEVPFDPKNPSRGVLPACVQPIFKMYYSLLYNSLNDVWVNHGIPNKSSKFQQNKPGGSKVRDMYKEVLFPETEYTGTPLASQFSYAVLRRSMVPDESLIVDEEVEQALETNIKRLGRNFENVESFVHSLLVPVPGRDTGSKQRYELILRHIEPLFDQMIKLDLERFTPQYKKPKPNEGGSEQGKGEGEGGGGGMDMSPYDSTINEHDKNSIDQISDEDRGKAKEFIKTTEAAKAEAAKINNRTPEERQADAAKKARASRIQAAVDGDPDLTTPEAIANRLAELTKRAEDYAKIIETVEPHILDLANYWLTLLGKGRSQARVEVNHKKMGSLSVDTAIKEWATIQSAEDPQPKIYNKIETREVLAVHPEEIRLAVLADMSGSMDKEKRKFLTEVCVLLSESIRQLQTIVENLGFAKQFNSSCQVIGYGDNAAGILNKDANIWEREIVPQKLNEDLGGTNNTSALALLSNTVTPEDTFRLKNGKLRLIVFEVTDGGSTNPNEAKELINTLSQVGALVRGFQIGTKGAISEEDTKIFQSMYEYNGAKIGEQVLELSELLPRIKTLLKEYTGDMRI